MSQLEAACAEMRQVLKKVDSELALHYCCGDRPHIPDCRRGWIEQALSSSAGQGWLSPEQAAEKDHRIEKLERTLRSMLEESRSHPAFPWRNQERASEVLNG